jgi:hypothetical protein
MKWLSSFLFENSPWSPFWSAWSVGYCIVGSDGQVYLTDAGAAYLEEFDAESARCGAFAGIEAAE